MPDSGHCSSAATSDSCARSSASPTSRTMRARPAISFADSILQTASMARCASVAVTATDHTIFTLVRASRSRARLLRRLLPEFRESGRSLLHLLREVLHLHHLPHLDDFIRASRTTLRPLDRLLARLHLDHPIASDNLLRFRKRPIGDRRLPVLERYPRPRRKRMQPVQ